MPELRYREFRAVAAPPTARARALARERFQQTTGRRRPTLRWRRLAGAVVLAAAIAIAAMVAWPTSSPTRAITIERAAAALTPEPGRILHVRADGRNIYTPWYEYWQTTSGPMLRRSRGGGSNAAGPCTLEYSYDEATQTMASWDAGTRTIYRNRINPPTGKRIAFRDPLAQIRQHLKDGEFREAGRKTLDGREVIRLVPAQPATTTPEAVGEGDPVFTYYVDAATYKPVRQQISPTQWYDYTTYEYLADDDQTHRLLTIEAQHPGAPIVEGSPSKPSCGAG